MDSQSVGDDDEDLPPPLTPKIQNTERSEDVRSSTGNLLSSIENPPPASTGEHFDDEMPPTAVLMAHEQRLSNLLGVTISGTNIPETQRLEESPNQTTEGQRICKDGPCLYETITLGETEKEQLKAVGIHLLQIGKELLDEMSFVEGLLGKFSSQMFDGKKDNQLGERQSKSQSQTLNKDLLKKEISDSMEAANDHGRRLSWIQQTTEEYKQAAKAAHYGSAFVSPDASNSKVVMNNAVIKQGFIPANSNAADLFAWVVQLESKIEGFNSKISKCESQLMIVHSSLRGLIDGILIEIALMKDEIAASKESGETHNSVNEKICTLQQQIVQLAKTIWELKCETRVQMHFGREINS